MTTKTFRILKMHFRSPLHLSKGKTDDYGESDELLHTDTLKSALYVCARQLQLAVVDDSDSFFRQFRISSAFPFLGNECFFPKPSVRLQPFDADEVAEDRQAKKHKKLAYLGQSYFEDLITDHNRHLRPADITADGRFISDHPATKEVQKGTGKLLSKVVFASDVQHRVTIPANPADDPLPYYVDRLYFADEAGLWFAFDGNDAVYSDVRAALHLLGDNGVGNDRSVGNGQFTVSETTLTLRLPDAPTHQVLLSLWCPDVAELDETFLRSSSYGLIKRGGYIASPDQLRHLTYRKKSVFMFTEGSVFPVGRGLTGKVLNLKPDAVEVTQNVWRDGLAFCLPISQISAS